VLGVPLATAEYLTLLRTLACAVTRAHAGWIAVGEISGSTVLVDGAGRMVLGRLSLSQVPSLGPHRQLLAPELVRGEALASDPAAAEAIDLYSLGCVALELATGQRPFASAELATEMHGHGHRAAPRLADLRPDLPIELSDLVGWLVEKRASARPRSAFDVLAQLDAIVDRLGWVTRSLRVLVVDDDPVRGRLLWSLARRAHAQVQVELASEGTEAAHKLNRDVPDLVLVAAVLHGVMNAYELCMYARGLPAEHHTQLVLVGEATPRDRLLFAEAEVPCIPDDAQLGTAVIERVRALATRPPRRRRPRTTVSG
jgi:CheY-like chemotaxis protein